MSSEAGLRMAASEEELASWMAECAKVIDLNSRLPNWPFLVPGYATICEFTRAVGGAFAPVLVALAEAAGDDHVTLVVPEPQATYYSTEYSFLAGFRVDRDALGTDAYARGLFYEPGGRATGAIAIGADGVAIVGSSGRWAVWAQRDWELGIVLAPLPSSPWHTVGIPFLSDARAAVEAFRGPPGWVMPLSDPEVETLARNIKARGSGG